MRSLAMTVFLLGCSIPALEAHEKSAKAECAEVRQQIRRIYSRLRAGYTAKTGIRLEARLRELKKKRARVCR
ncbi:MAG: hypothetical protein HKN35_09365 [Woeseia sp.]|nr:hypothetical protein [Woeseia sp.]MBT8095947.1 hypothetical protein [Woeseia sp.]NNE61092.1 hypothetical protein [Woeseia sp.]NNL53773.1 hypothetical protein [Woeseia sp.]